ncbi:MAG: hypothetical protein NTY01_08800 [Verrucomicrobia bacterium]|nr:hypothetical protein [Verrucomicrobiota bacterium]
MNLWIICTLCAVATVGAGFLFAKLATALWNFACPQSRTGVPPVPSSINGQARCLSYNKTTAAAAELVGAAMLIEARLCDADSIGTPLDNDELMQLDQAIRKIEFAIGMLRRYESREYRKLCPPIDHGLPVSDAGAGLNEPKSARPNSKLQTANSQP